MKKRVIFLSLIFLALLASFLVFFWFQPQKKLSYSNKIFFYDDFSDNWQPTSNQPIAVDIKKENKNTDGFHNDSVLRGFFDHYDQESDILYMKSVIPLSGEQALYEDKSFKVGLQKSFYCAPSKVIDQKTGESTDTQINRFPVYDGATLYTYYESQISIDKFLEKANKNTWIFVQLTSPYDNNLVNHLYKLVAVGLCE